MSGNIIDIQRYSQETELFFVPELCSKIIQKMQEYGCVILRSREARCFRTNGLYQLLDNLCAYWHWDPRNIILETSNWIESHPVYTIRYILFTVVANHRVTEICPKPWNKEKVYGMFIGRANATRIRGLHNHLNFKYQTLGLTSFHNDMSYHVDNSALLEYLTESNQCYKDAIGIPPYSDIDHVRPLPITDGTINTMGWENVYEKIGIELVFETDPVETAMTFTEKLLRPMLYKRPFLTVAGRHHNKRIENFHSLIPDVSNGVFNDPELKDMVDDWRAHGKPFNCFNKQFSELMGDNYDFGQGISRVDHVFDILQHLIETKKVYHILDEWQEIIEENYIAVHDIFRRYKEITQHTVKLFNYEDWVQ